MGFGGPFEGFMFGFIPLFVFLIFAIVISAFIIFAIRGVIGYFRNNGMPKQSVPARLIGKRTHTWGGHGNMSSHTSYYATFELENGDRIEMPVGGNVYGLNTEGDTGILTYQGTRFYSFEREHI